MPLPGRPTFSSVRNAPLQELSASHPPAKDTVPRRDLTAHRHHRRHEVTDPPVNHLADIVANANRFHQKWRTWPMEPWLTAFRDLGLIAWDAESAEPAAVLRPPLPDLTTRLTRPNPVTSNSTR